jgi:hypothetical protein
MVKGGRITYETAVERCHNVDELNRMLGRGTGSGGGMGGM